MITFTNKQMEKIDRLCYRYQIALLVGSEKVLLRTLKTLMTFVQTTPSHAVRIVEDSLRGPNCVRNRAFRLVLN